MKIFFIGERRNEANMKMNEKIIKVLEAEGNKVDKSLIQHSHEEDNANFDKAYQRNLKSIKNCDVVVAEITTTSSGQGFLLATAINQKKPVVAMYNSDSKIKPSITLEGVNSRLFNYLKYSESNIDTVVKKAISKVKQTLDTKFILIISAEIDRYLEWASNERRMHKAQIVRNSVEDAMAKDKEWKKSQE